MKSSLLLPDKCKIIGWVTFFAGLITGGYYLINGNDSLLETKFFAIFYSQIFSKTQFLGWVRNGILDEIASTLIIIGALLIMFSKQKDEDEFIASLRLNALLWAVIINYFILLLAIFFVYDLSFFGVLVFNMFTILFIFILRFYWLLHKASEKEKYEE